MPPKNRNSFILILEPIFKFGFDADFKPLSMISWTIHFAVGATEAQPQERLGYLAKVNS